MIKYLLTLVFLIKLIYATQKSDGILILRDSNIDETIRKNKYILVNFYAPRAEKSKAFEKEYLKLNEILREYESDIVLAKIDATKGLSNRFRVEDLPSVSLHIEGTPVRYTGEMVTYQILQWLHKKTKPTTRVIRNIQELKDFEEDNEMAIIGLFSSLASKDAKLLKDIAKTIDDAAFAITDELTVFKELGFEGSESIVILKKNEGKYNLSGKFFDSKIRKFISQYRLPLIYEYNPNTNIKLFENEVKVNLMFFSSKSSRNYAKDIIEFKQAADKLRGKVTFVLIDIDQTGKTKTAYDFLGEQQQEFTFFQAILRFFGIKRHVQPRVHLVSIFNNKPTFYRLELNETDSISSEMISQFIEDFFNSRIKPHRKSEPIPNDWDSKPVKVLVAKNFDQIARDRKKAVLVKFFSSSNHECKRLAPMYERLAESFKNEPEMMVAKINGVANEIEEIKIEKYPAFKLFPRGSKKMIDFKGDPSFENLSAFLKSNGKEMTPAKKKDIDEFFNIEPEKLAINEEL